MVDFGEEGADESHFFEVDSVGVELVGGLFHLFHIKEKKRKEKRRKESRI